LAINSIYKLKKCSADLFVGSRRRIKQHLLSVDHQHLPRVQTLSSDSKITIRAEFRAVENT